MDNLLSTLSPSYRLKLYFIITLYTTATLHGHPTLPLPSTLTPFYMDNLLFNYLHSTCTTYTSSLLFTLPPRSMDILHYICHLN